MNNAECDSEAPSPAYDLERHAVHFGPAIAGFAKLLDTMSEAASSAEKAMEHQEAEALISERQREISRQVFQGHLNQMASMEHRHEQVMVGADEVERPYVESRSRAMESVFGEVEISRLAYRSKQKDSPDLHPLDRVLNLPAGRQSHGVRRLVARRSASSSFERVMEEIKRESGLHLSKAQAEKIVAEFAVDFDAFFKQRQVELNPRVGELLILTCDGKGISMIPSSLREATQRAREKALAEGMSDTGGNRKRMAEVASVYSAEPVIRSPVDIIPTTKQERQERKDGPQAEHKWLTASVKDGMGTVIASMFEEAERRDPDHVMTWVVLLDGNAKQIEHVKAQARTRKVEVTIVLDYIHVREYVEEAARDFYDTDEGARRRWVKEKMLKILDGKAGLVAGAIGRKATYLELPNRDRHRADACASYLLNNRKHLRYDIALAAGMPIATGVIEGACRHLIQDRMGITGARWSVDGAEAVLKIRALVTNGLFEDYAHFHIKQEKLRNYETKFGSSKAA